MWFWRLGLILCGEYIPRLLNGEEKVPTQGSQSIAEIWLLREVAWIAFRGHIGRSPEGERRTASVGLHLVLWFEN